MAVTVSISCDRCGAKVPRPEWARVRLGPGTRKRNGRKSPIDLCEDCLEEVLLVPLGLLPPGLFPPEPEGGALTRHPLLERTAKS